MPAGEAMLLYGVGDVAPCRNDLASMFRGVASLLRTGDVVFGQLESTVSAGGTRNPAARLAMRTRPAAAGVIRAAGFTHMSFAGNHCMDWGGSAFDDTLVHMADAGVVLCGAGADLVAARRPATVTVAGTRLAFLARSAILPEGYAAAPGRPGCAPLRARTVHERIGHDQPGTACRIRTFPDRQDLACLIDDVRAAKARADVLVLSLHWGLHFVPGEIADYQRDVAHAAIDAGADMILGHHPHILKGVDVYRGRPIFYSLGNFAIEQPWAFERDVRSTDSYRHLTSLSPGWKEEGQYMLPEETRRTLIVKCEIAGGCIRRTSMIPAFLTTSSEPEVLPPGDSRYHEVVAYVTELSRSQGLQARFEPGSAEVAVL